MNWPTGIGIAMVAWDAAGHARTAIMGMHRTEKVFHWLYARVGPLAHVWVPAYASQRRFDAGWAVYFTVAIGLIAWGSCQ